MSSGISNFSFFRERFPALEKLGSLAEGYLYSDPNACLYKLGMMAEMAVKYMLELDNIAVPEVDDTPSSRIKLLKREGMLPRDVDDMLYALRSKRNIAVHEGRDCSKKNNTPASCATSSTKST